MISSKKLNTTQFSDETQTMKDTVAYDEAEPSAYIAW